nr:hypothetical protein [Legionella jordanis]
MKKKFEWLQSEKWQEPTPVQIAAAHKSGLSSIPTGAEIPWDILNHPHYKEVDSVEAEKLVQEKPELHGVLLRKASVVGQTAVTVLTPQMKVVKYLLANQELNLRASACNYYKINLADTVVELTQAYHLQSQGKYADFIFAGIDETIQQIKNKIQKDNEERAAAYFLVNDSPDFENEWKPEI